MKHLAFGTLFAVLACRPACSDRATPPPPRVDPQWLAGELPAAARRPAPRGVQGGRLVIRVPTEPAGLSRIHDAHRDGVGARMVMGPVYETLFAVDLQTRPAGTLQPLLATVVESTPDGRRHVVRLRTGARFHDGAPFGAKDVVATLDAILHPKNATDTARSQLAELAEYRALDAATVELIWKRPSYVGFRTLMAHTPMLPSGQLQGDFGNLPLHRAPVGTGPYRFVSWQTQQSVTLRRYDSYWGTPGVLDEIIFRVVPEGGAATELFRKGEFDLMTAISPTLWRQLELPTPENRWVQEGYHRVRFAENSYAFVAWNHRHPHLRDIRVRTALAMLVPHNELSRGLDLGLEEPTTCPFYRHSPACDPAVARLPHDPARATSILEQAGFRDEDGDDVVEREGQALALTLLIASSSVKASRLATVLKDKLGQAGVRVVIEPLEWGLFLQRVRAHQFDAAALAWSAQDAEQDVFPAFHSSQTDAQNYGQYSNPEVDALLEQVRAEFDDSKRAALQRRLHRKLYEDQVYLFLSSRPSLDAVRRGVSGLIPSIAWYDLSRVWLDSQER